MLKVYNLMGLGLLITGIAAWGAFQLAVTGDGQLTAFGTLIYASAFRWVVILAPLAAVFFLSFRIQSMSVAAAQTTFWVYSGLVGLSLSTIFLVYTGRFDHPDLLRHGGRLRRAVALWLHDQARPFGVRLVPGHGRRSA